MCAYLLFSCILNVVEIIVEPVDDTVCLTQREMTASYTCVVDRGVRGITSGGWHILDDGAFILINGRPHHMSNPMLNGSIITDTLTITNVSVNDNGALYRCQPFGSVSSMNVTLIVLGEVVICLSCAF